MANKYGVASDYIKYTSRIKSDTSDGVAVEASQVVDLEEDKLQSDINKELKASIASASGNTYSKSEIDGKDTATLTSAKSYADTKKTEAVNAAATDAATKANAALASAKSYADERVSALGSVYTTKGSCTAAQLKALTSAKDGDVWNITDAITIDGKAYPAGVNVVCVTAFAGTIDPATTRIWDALQGLQDLTSYAKWSQVEEAAINDVKFERDVAGEDSSITLKKTLTYIDGHEQEVDFGIVLDPATSTKAGVMSAADKVKLDAVDGKIGDVKIKIEGEKGYAITKKSNTDFGTSFIGKKVNIGESASIGDNAKLGSSVVIQDDISIGTDSSNDSFRISRAGSSVTIGYEARIESNVIIKGGVEIGSGVNIGSDIKLGQEGSQQNIFGVIIGTERGLGLDASGNFIWEINGSKKTAATTDDLSALATRVSALEDLLKLA